MRKTRSVIVLDNQYAVFNGSEYAISDDKDADEVPGKGDEDVNKVSGSDDQERTDSSTQDINIAGPSINTASTDIKTGSLNINTISLNDPNMPSLEETGIFDGAYDDEDVGVEGEYRCVSKVLDTAYQRFLGVGTTFDIFQNILFPYSLNTAYCLLLDTTYWILFPSWSLVSAGTGYATRVGFAHSRWMFLSQKKYALELLESTHMTKCNPTWTPADIEPKLGPEGISIFLFMHDPREPHLAALKCILRYVQGTLDLGLHLYSFASTSLIVYFVSNWASCPSTRRSTSGYCVFLGDNLLSWSSKRPHTLLRSSAEAE
ncbi:ribonuclease H-like domain-containing protein [Tanacetum coccineum]